MVNDLLGSKEPSSFDTEQSEDKSGLVDVEETRPETFDLTQWIEGVRPIKRVVTLYSRLDLMGKRDEIADEMRQARGAGDYERVDELKKYGEELTKQILASRMIVTLQGVTASRFKEILEEAEQKSCLETSEDIFLYQIAAQIVEPENLDYKALKIINELLPTQAATLGKAWEQINNQVPNVSATAPF